VTGKRETEKRVRRAQRVEQMTRELGLTSDQAKQLDAILMQWHAEVKTMHEQSDAQIEQLRQERRNQIRAILTPQQKPKFEEFLTKLDAD
jgi:periplasmic protein CpxP/Spy